MDQRIVICRPLPCPNRIDFTLNGNHRVTESVNLVNVLAFRRLDHERARHRKGHGGRVEAVVH